MSAIESYDKAISLNFQSLGLHEEKTLALLKLNKYEEAIKCCNQSIKMYPYNPKAYLHKSIALIHLDNLKEASYVCDQALKVDPDDRNALRTKELILQAIDKRR